MLSATQEKNSISTLLLQSSNSSPPPTRVEITQGGLKLKRFFWGKLNAYFAKEMTSWPQCLKLFQKVSIISTDSDLLFEFWSPKSKREMMRLFWGFSYGVTIALISCPFIVVIIRQMSLFPSVDQGYIWRRWIAFYQLQGARNSRTRAKITNVFSKWESRGEL